MHKKALLLVLPVLALLLALLACGESTPPQVGSRSNPAPAGSEVTVDDMILTVGEVVRPADEIVAAGNAFNSKPEAGYEFVMVTVSVRCEKGEDESCIIGPSWDFALVGSANLARDAKDWWEVTGVDGRLETTEFFGGSTVTGSLFFEVGQDETDLVLRYVELLGKDTAFLALQ